MEGIEKYLKYNPIDGTFTVIKARRKWKVGDVVGVKPHKTRGYCIINYDKFSYPAHRIAFYLMEEEVPEQVDHLNQIRSDNRWCNLKASTHFDNQYNKGMQSNNTSGFTGVYYVKNIDKWEAKIMVNQKNLGRECFDSFEDAVRHRVSLEIKYGFTTNHGKVHNGYI